MIKKKQNTMSVLKSSNYGVLYNMMFNLSKFKTDYWALAIISDSFKKESKRFEDFNILHLKNLMKRQMELYKEYVEQEEVDNGDGTTGNQFTFLEPSTLHVEGAQPKKQAHTGVDGRVPKFYSDEAEEKFNAAWDALLLTPCDITI